MAQRKKPSGAVSKSAGRQVAATRPPARGNAGRGSTATKVPNGSRPPVKNSGQKRKPSKSIVNQKQTPWGLIATAVVLVLFASGIVAYAATRKSTPKVDAQTKTYVQPEIAAAKAITGMIYKKEPNHLHVAGTVKYDTSPPIGGNHSQYWANCTGTVYTHQIANENAVHMLEHGAVWITYNPKTITAADLATLKTDVLGTDRLALSPYAGLKTPISLQAWDYQLFVSSAKDKRVNAFIDALKDNPKTLPEAGVSCSDPNFNAAKSTLGHPFEG